MPIGTPLLFTDNAAAILAIGGFAIGFAFGATVFVTNFCTMGAIADIVTSQDYRRFRSWVLAAGVALAGSQALAMLGAVDLSQSIYLRGGLNWLGNLAGGLIFGFGMVLAGGCPSRNLVRAGAGDLRALTTLLVMGLFAHIALTGLLSAARTTLHGLTEIDPPAGSTQSLADLAAYLAGAGHGMAARIAVAGSLAASALLYCFSDARFRSSWRHVASGIAVGLCAIAGWGLTAFADDEFAETRVTPASLSFIASVGQSLDYLTRVSSMQSMSFGAAIVFGCLAGGFGAALATGRFQLQGFADAADTGRNLAGAALMGIGGVMALGCSIGQGVTGISTMAAGSFLAFAAMASGAVIGVKYLESRL
jgi:uncharacterized membrane protein YedE/YeeE